MRDCPFLLFAAIHEHALDHLEHLDHVRRGHLLRGAAQVKSELVENLGQFGLQVRAEQFVIFAQLPERASNEGQARRNAASSSPIM